MKNIVFLLRVRHYIKNILIYLPLVFIRNTVQGKQIFHCTLGFVSFCLICSMVYIINDIRDIEQDKLHPTKCKRPLASGAISQRTGIFIAVACFLVSVGILVGMALSPSGINPLAFCWLLLYLVLNLSYSLGLKNFPIIDVVILMSGFLIRLLFGATLVGTVVSSWLHLTVMCGAFYFALGKRRNEIQNKVIDGKTRKVLSFYTQAFLDKFMYVCLAMAIIFYALWAKEYQKKYMIVTVPICIVVCMRYSLDVEQDSDGDPVEVVLKDKILLALCAIFIALILGVLFVK